MSPQQRGTFLVYGLACAAWLLLMLAAVGVYGLAMALMRADPTDQYFVAGFLSYPVSAWVARRVIR